MKSPVLKCDSHDNGQPQANFPGMLTLLDLYQNVR